MKRLTTKNRPWRSCSVSFDRKFDTVSKLQSWQIEPRRPLTSSNFSTFIGFPTTLYDMLESALDEGYSNLMSWFEDGQSFRTPTRREKKFTTDDTTAIIQCRIPIPILLLFVSYCCSFYCPVCCWCCCCCFVTVNYYWLLFIIIILLLIILTSCY